MHNFAATPYYQKNAFRVLYTIPVTFVGAAVKIQQINFSPPRQSKAKGLRIISHTNMKVLRCDLDQEEKTGAQNFTKSACIKY